MAKKQVNPNEGKFTSDYLSIDEFTRLLDCLDKDKEYFWETYALVQFCTGLRISDVRTLTWGDMLQEEFDKHEIKTGKKRDIFVADELIIARLRDLYIKQGKPGANKLILASGKTSNTGTAVSAQYINRVIKTWKEKYNLKVGNFSSHSFRKTFGRCVYDSYEGASREDALLLLCDIFNHTKVEVTKRYLGIRKSEIKKVYSNLLSGHHHQGLL